MEGGFYESRVVVLGSVWIYIILMDVRYLNGYKFKIIIIEIL